MTEPTLSITDEMLQRADRRTFLAHHVPQCSNCFRNQTQLIDHAQPALWKCRVCRHQFNYEPVPSAPID